MDLIEGKVLLTPLQTKMEQARVPLYSDLHRVLQEARRRRDAKYPACPWVCQRQGKRVGLIRKAWLTVCQRVGLEGRLIHDFRRTAVRNMIRAGVPEVVAMAISGHRTRSFFDRYDIVSEGDLLEARRRLQESWKEAYQAEAYNPGEHTFEHSDRDWLDGSSLSM